MGYWKHNAMSQKTTSVLPFGKTFFVEHFRYLSTFMQIKFIFAPFGTKAKGNLKMASIFH